MQTTVPSPADSQPDPAALITQTLAALARQVDLTPGPLELTVAYHAALTATGAAADAIAEWDRTRTTL